VNDSAKPICAKCAERNGAPFICPTCGKPGRQHSKDQCHSCYWRRRLANRVEEAQSQLKNNWAKELFSEFFDYTSLRAGGDVKRISHRVQAYTRFFVELERLCGGPDTITIEIVYEAFALTDTFRHDLIRNFLVENKYLERRPNRAWQNLRYVRKSRLIVAAAKGAWYEQSVRQYYDHLLSYQRQNRTKGFSGDYPKPSESSVAAYLSAAIGWFRHLDQSGHESLSSVSQDDVGSFLAEKPGYRDSLRVFLRYANQTKLTFSRLKIETRKQKQFLKYYINEKESQKLITNWLAAKGGETKYALICLLAILYAQPLRRVLEIKMTDVALTKNGGARIAIQKYELQIDSRVRAVLDRYLVQRSDVYRREKAWESEYLFPSTLSGHHASPYSVREYLKPFKLNYQNLYTTALVNAFSHGLRFPKVAVQGLGVTLPTAIDYARIVDERVSTELADSGLLE